MARSGTWVLLLLIVPLAAWPAGAAAPVVAYEGRTYAALVAGRTLAESLAAANGPYAREDAPAALGDGPLRAEGVRAEFEGGDARSVARFSAALVRLRVNGLTVEARGVESEAIASCWGGQGGSRVDEVRVAGEAVARGLDGGRVDLPGGLALLLHESSGQRTAVIAEQAASALRLVDATGATLAVLGHAEARAHGCIQASEGVCEGFAPLAVATARAGDRRGGGPSEALVQAPGGEAVGADHAWLNGVWTNVQLDHDPARAEATLTLRGASVAKARVAGGVPDALVLRAEARGGAVEVDDLRVQGLAVEGLLGARDGSAAWTLRSPVLRSGLTVEGSVRLSWDGAPGADDLRLVLQPGRCG